jgi:hypothetical protein
MLYQPPTPSPLFPPVALSLRCFPRSLCLSAVTFSPPQLMPLCSVSPSRRGPGRRRRRRTSSSHQQPPPAGGRAWWHSPSPPDLYPSALTVSLILTTGSERAVEPGKERRRKRRWGCSLPSMARSAARTRVRRRGGARWCGSVAEIPEPKPESGPLPSFYPDDEHDGAGRAVHLASSADALSSQHTVDHLSPFRRKSHPCGPCSSPPPCRWSIRQRMPCSFALLINSDSGGDGRCSPPADHTCP